MNDFKAYRAEIERLLGRPLVKWEIYRARNAFSYRLHPEALVALIRSGR